MHFGILRHCLLTLVIVCLILSGCERKGTPDATSQVNRGEFDDLEQLISETIDNDWVSTIDPSSLFNSATYTDGDLVPCSDDQAEFVLEIRAMSNTSCFYQRQQPFRRFQTGGKDPRSEPRVTPEHLVCAMLVNGFASGCLHYTQFTPESVGVRIDWTASQNDDSQQFVGEFGAAVNQSGIAKAGNENKFAWSFAPASRKINAK